MEKGKHKPKKRFQINFADSYFDISGCKWGISFPGIYGGLLMTASNVVEPRIGKTVPANEKKGNTLSSIKVLYRGRGKNELNTLTPKI